MLCHASRRAISVSSVLEIQSDPATVDTIFTLDIICPDNDVNEALDRARMEWSANDVAQNRPALSRWHKDYKDEFDTFVKDKTGK